jgi:rubrerythrin
MTGSERERLDAANVAARVPESADPASRRRFMQAVGTAGAGAAMAILLAACGDDDEEDGTATEESGPPEPATDLEIVNYALFLEYLEEDFYRQVIESGEITEPRLMRLMRSIRQNETEHADVLTGVAEQLGGTPVARPKSRFGDVIEGGRERILEVASTIENLGASAYLGQAPRIENLRVLESALAIHTVEARHAAALNEIAGNGFAGGGKLAGSVPDGAFAQPMTREEVLTAAAPYVKG